MRNYLVIYMRNYLGIYLKYDLNVNYIRTYFKFVVLLNLQVEEIIYILFRIPNCFLLFCHTKKVIVI